MGTSKSSQPRKAGARNGKIELYRFIFSIYVLFFHFDKYLLSGTKFGDEFRWAFFPHGAMGVEFFFLVSGWLMAKSVSKLRSNAPEDKNRFIPSEGTAFMKHKYLSLMPQHLPAFAIAFVTYALYNELTLGKTIIKAGESLPNLLLVQMSGINFTNPNHVEWYLSCMLLAMAIVFPILRAHYEAFTKYIAPLGALLICGWMIYSGGALTGVTKWTGLCYRSVLRAVAEISLGTTAYELSNHLGKQELTAVRRIGLTAAEIACFLLTTLYVVTAFPTHFEVYILALQFIMVTIAFSGVSFGTKALSNRFFGFLGKLSLPIYLSQVSAINLTLWYMPNGRYREKLICATLLTAALSALIMALGAPLSRLIIRSPKNNKA